MKPVNLLPEQYRPRSRSGDAAGGGRIVIGVLAALLVMAVAYALTANKVNSHKSDIAAAKSDIQRDEAQTASQGAFGSFHDVKQTREASVKQLADGRFDWERLMREVALVLPTDTWVLHMTTTTPSEQSSTGAPAASSSPPASSGGAVGANASGEPTSPTLHLLGCAMHQPEVAVLLVRLRKLDRVTEVDLNESAKEDDSANGAPTDAATAGSENCGGGRFKFDVNVTFASPQPVQSEGGRQVPASLGGGS